MNKNQLYYVQNVSQGMVGNSILWWKEGNCGYVCDVRLAKKFTQAEIDKLSSIKEGVKRAWPVEYIDMRIQHHVDFQDCKHEIAMQVIRDGEQSGSSDDLINTGDE